MYALAISKLPKPDGKTENQHYNHRIEQPEVVSCGSDYQHSECA